MPPLTAAEIVSLWERGAARHPIDRALLLAAAARPDLRPDALPDLPLGARNLALLSLRRSTFGRGMRTYVDCPECAVRLQSTLDTDTFLAAGTVDERAPTIESGTFSFRAPTSRDLAAVRVCADAEAAASQLLERCCVTFTTPDTTTLMAMRQEIEHSLEALDPCAVLELALTCDACGYAWTAPLDVAALVWDEVDARARALMIAVHALAGAYGWSERAILALGEQRRAAYLAMVGA